ncbi:MAG: tungsten ABC transporter substrate-binding protein [Spirochaetes bacterium GWF1_31_7]|nr:MAG: tungsten ABC transporter substrate-binding protein [Spirochaetes bacterium GWE1_32_154]OHD47100.1 MAG: tungsten ABC transporter substrate-binding protein [Spirochaetes bacterium GWF1_31_7]OHD51992.1 MAG: tungsten ABC transporter substrate-binding protein [Spirochaetes bacterium GWE2_31_10]HBI38295.1 tungsten ABC transporter substrate-binding protein [Spirochaetia bacterium]
MKNRFYCVLIMLIALFSCKKEEIRIKLATTTSTENSGLLHFLLPHFEKETNIKVDVIAVGTGKALKLGENGDVDVVLVHARSLEDTFVEKGFGVNRKDVMFNDFVLVGEDKGYFKAVKDISECFTLISTNQLDFISRGDNSGTHVKELEIWNKTGIKPQGTWYKEIGQGMEQALTMADAISGITLTDRGTYLAMKNNVKISILFQGDENLNNPYGVIAVNPEKWPSTQYKESMKFINWLTSKKGQTLISEYKVNGEQLFFPSNVTK